MIELKRCPFCGGEASLIYLPAPDCGVSGIRCGSCKVVVRWGSIKTEGREPFGIAMDKYAAAWNRRVTDEMEDDLK